MTADQIVDEIKRQFRPLADRGLKPDHIEMSEQYAEQLNPRYLRAHLVAIALNERDGDAVLVSAGQHVGGTERRLCKLTRAHSRFQRILCTKMNNLICPTGLARTR